MPVYSITDTLTKETVLVSADTSAQAARLYMGDRLYVSAALHANQTLALSASGVRVISAPEPDADETPLPFSQSPDAKAFAEGFEDCDKGGEKVDV